jgi:hypothetical protein
VVGNPEKVVTVLTVVALVVPEYQLGTAYGM